MKKIAITGNIAAGKSTVQNIIAAKGYTVLDVDVLAHEILAQSQEANQAFKDYDVFEDGKISRRKLGELVFANSELKKQLEDIIHPKVRAAIKDYTGSDIVFAGIPLLFEAKMESLFDAVIFVYADDNIRLERLLNRNKYTAEHAKSRIASQLPQDEKAKLSDYIIENNGDLEHLAKQVLALPFITI
jgi:dephospho-CoA kinase